MSANRPVEQTPGDTGAWGTDGDGARETADAPVSPGAAEAAAAYAAAAEADPGLSFEDAALETDVSEAAQAAGVPACEPDGAGGEREVVLDPDELAARAEQADQYLLLAQRTKADFDNYRKRATRDAAAAQERGIAKLAKELLPAIDNLDRAVQAVLAAAPASAQESDEDSQLASGIRLVYADLLAALARVGIEPFSPVGEQFDPQYHEAVAQSPFEGAEPGTVVEVYQLGYRLGETVLRPARVLVAA